VPAIATLTVNPAVDLSTQVDEVVPAHKLRCGPPLVHPGGGGVNVARVLSRLGCDVLACHTAGGPVGDRLCRLLDAEAVRHRAIPIAGDTRENLTVTERATGREFRFVLPGPTLSDAEWRACFDAVAGPDAAPWIVASGGLAPGVPTDLYGRLAGVAREHGIRLVVDSAGEPLAAALRGGVHLVKPSLRELRLLTGEPLATAGEQLAAARRIVDTGGASLVALSLGPDGAWLVSADAALHADPLDVPVASTVGAGDSFLAGLLASLMREQPLDVALADAAAAGSAALLAPGTALARPDDIRRLRPLVRITTVA